MLPPDLTRSTRAEPMEAMTTPPSNLWHPELRALYSLWLSHCPNSNEGVPLAGDLEPSELRRWLGNVLIMDATEEGGFAYSYYGRSLARAFGETRLGQTLEALPAEQKQILHQEYGQVRAGRKPLHRRHTADFNGIRRTWERVVFPLSSDGEAIDKLLVAAYEL